MGVVFKTTPILFETRKSMFIMKKLISLLMITLSVVFSQNATITGKITDTAKGNPLIGANVVITGDKINTGAASDFEGNYTIKNIPPGSYDLKVTYIGYRRDRKSGV